MRLIRLIRHRFNSLFRKSRQDAALDREIEVHFEQLVKQAISSGMSDSEARTVARREFGSRESVKEFCRDARKINRIDELKRDIRYAFRMIRTRPGFSIPALLSLALGIGANVAIFSVANAVLIRPLPYAHAEQLVGVDNSASFPGLSVPVWPLSLDLYAAYEQNARCFQEFGVWNPGSSAVMIAGTPEQVPTATMTNGVLRALNTKPLLGRWFTKADEAPGAQRTVILSYRYWHAKFAGNPKVVGQFVVVDFVPYQIVGVMPSSFEFLNVAPDLFLAQTVIVGAPGSQDADLFGVARLRPGISLSQANQDVARVLRIWSQTNPAWQEALRELHVRPNVHPLKQDVIGDVGPVLTILMGALVVVLLLVCANVANLVQVRAQARRAEFAVRAALGAGWQQIARQLMIESLSVASVGGVAGLAVAYLGLRLLVTHGPKDLPRVAEISIDGTSLLFAVACSILTGVLFGLIAVLNSNLRSKLQNTRAATRTKQQVRTQSVLVVVQVALALTLLIGAGLLVRSFLALTNVNPGFTHPEQIQTMRLFFPEARVSSSARVAQMQADILRGISAIPGVRAAAFATAMPLQLEYHNGNPVSGEGKTSPGQVPPNCTIKRISPGLFRVLGTRLITGRDFTWNDLFGQHPVAIISEQMARENWKSPQEALGKRIRLGDEPWNVIVGVVENVYDDGVDQPPPALVYFPGVRRGATFAVRTTRAGTPSLVREMTGKVRAVDSGLPLAEVETLRDLYRSTMARRSFALVLLGIAAAMAVTLSVVGVYGVLAYAVAQRRREISIRLAVGAEPRAITSLFLRQGLLLMYIGLATGFCSALILSRGLTSLLFRVKPFDWMTYSVAGATILAAALAASYLPARRAATLNPIEALRVE